MAATATAVASTSGGRLLLPLNLDLPLLLLRRTLRFENALLLRRALVFNGPLHLRGTLLLTCGLLSLVHDLLLPLRMLDLFIAPLLLGSPRLD